MERGHDNNDEDKSPNDVNYYNVSSKKYRLILNSDSVAGGL